MASEYRVMNIDGTYVVQRKDGYGVWEKVAWTNDIKAAKELVNKYRQLKD